MPHEGQLRIEWVDKNTISSGNQLYRIIKALRAAVGNCKLDKETKY